MLFTMLSNRFSSKDPLDHCQKIHRIIPVNGRKLWIFFLYILCFFEIICGLALMPAHSKALLKNLYSFDLKVESVFSSISVDPSSINFFSTPMAWYNGSLFVVTVEPPKGKSTKLNLRTFLYKGRAIRNGKWIWVKKLLEDRTLEDRYHSQPSVAVDRLGFVHVVYNMHNMPWQYLVSKRPESISSFEFKGIKINRDDLYAVKFKNKCGFFKIDGTSIPGTQITYPAFFYDRNGDIYITYRFAVHPRQPWTERGFAGGIAKYDISERKWVPIGGPVNISKSDLLSSFEDNLRVFPFAYENHWTVYLPRLFFDKKNYMHVSWLWRKGGPGRNCVHPSYAFSPPPYREFFMASGSRYDLPISERNAELIVSSQKNNKFYPLSSIAVDLQGRPWIVLNPIGATRCLVHYKNAKGEWSEPEPMPFGCSQIYIDMYGVQWAFGSGPCIFRRDLQLNGNWIMVYRSEGYGYPKILPIPKESKIFLFVQKYDGSKIKILRVSLYGQRES